MDRQLVEVNKAVAEFTITDDSKFYAYHRLLTDSSDRLVEVRVIMISLATFTEHRAADIDFYVGKFQKFIEDGDMFNAKLYMNEAGVEFEGNFVYLLLVCVCVFVCVCFELRKLSVSFFFFQR